jgi:integrase
MPLPAQDEHVTVVYMLTPSHAVDLYIGDLQRKSRSKSGRTAYSYQRVLYKFADMLEAGGRHVDVKDISADDCRRFLDRYLRQAPNYQALIYSYLNSFLEWLYLQERIRRNPLDHVPRPRRVAAADLDVVTIDTADVPLLFQACESETERLTIALLAYMGPRRHAAATRRRQHYNRELGLLEFAEKGGKTIRKPVPDELRVLIDNAIDSGLITEPDGYIIPAEGKLHRKGERDDRVVWRIVTRVADRAGVRCTVHALRAAFATFYLERYPEKGIVSLQMLMGHESISTTQVYLRKLDRRSQMEQVRDLAWSSAGVVDPDNLPTKRLGEDLAPTAEGRIDRYTASPVVGEGGFEPPFRVRRHE